MTQRKYTPQAAERFCELLAELSENPFTSQFESLTDHTDDALRDLVQADLNRNVEADAVRFNKARIAEMLTKTMAKSNAKPQAAPVKTSGAASDADLSHREKVDALYEQYKGEADVTIPIQRILLARESCGDSTSIEYQRELLADAVATLIGSSDTAPTVHAALVTWIKELRGKTVKDDLWPDNLRESFGEYLNEIDGQAKDATEADEPPLTDEQVNDITEATVNLMALPLPEDLRERLSVALTECLNDIGVAEDSPQMLRAWMPRFLREKVEN